MKSPAATRIAAATWAVTVALALPAVVLLARNYPSLGGILSSPATVNGVLALTFAIVGGLIVARRPGNLIGWIFCVEGIANGLATLAVQYARYTLQTQPGSLPGGVWAAWLGSWSWVPGLGLLALLLLLFPDGHLPSSRWRPVAWLALAWIVVNIASIAVRPGPLLSSAPTVRAVAATNPLGIADAEAVLRAFGTFAISILALLWLASIVSLILRFRRGGDLARQQLKWFLYAAALFAAAFLASLLPGLPDELSVASEGLKLVAAALLPASVGVAILRHRLYDIDRLISRTLAYGALTATLALVYYCGVVAFQGGLRGISGQTSDLAIVASTLGIAALFQPLRRRIQRFIDRRCYRRRYDAARVVGAFSASARDEVDLSHLTTHLLEVVDETMQPAHVSLWLIAPPGSGHRNVFRDDSRTVVA